jgi:hypothetical protein
MRIQLNNHDTRYGVTVETDSMDVEIYEAFVGPIFWTSNDEGLGVCMRDSGYELSYTVGDETLTVKLDEGQIFVNGLRVYGEVATTPAVPGT